MPELLSSCGFNITQNGKALSEPILAAIQQITIEDEINVPTVFNFKLSMLDFTTNTWQGINLDTFEPGDAIRIEMGLEHNTMLVEGQIFALEPYFNDFATLSVSGYDRLYLLNFGTHTTTFSQTTDSEIASRIARSVGLLPNVEPTYSLIPYIQQHNQTNYSFLAWRCAELNYEMFVSNQHFIYRAARPGQAPLLNFTYGVDLINLRLRLKVLTQGSQVNVVSWSSENKTTITGYANHASPKAKMGGTQTANQFLDSFPTSPTTIENLHVISDQAAKIVAQAQYDQLLNQFIEGEGECIGNSLLRAGINIQLNGLGDKFSGIYYIISSMHTFDYTQGYRTSFKVRRSGI